MPTAKKNFDALFEHFKTSPEWKAMVNTREDSPWHREANVGVHTNMLLDWYLDNRYSLRSDRQRMLTMVACLFHDVGKPPAEIVKESPERGVYRAYHGHEQLSARIWTDYAMTNLKLVQDLTKFGLLDIANVAMMLEHHVPFGLKDVKKRQALKRSFMVRMGPHGHQAWLDLLMSDQHGRNSDDQPKKLSEVYLWMEDWANVGVPGFQ